MESQAGQKSHRLVFSRSNLLRCLICRYAFEQRETNLPLVGSSHQGFSVFKVSSFSDENTSCFLVLRILDRTDHLGTLICLFMRNLTSVTSEKLTVYKCGDPEARFQRPGLTNSGKVEAAAAGVRGYLHHFNQRLRKMYNVAL